MNTVIEHTVQRDILVRLTQAKTLRFSELKPDGLENNAFMYHLRELIKAKYVTQTDDKAYTLTAAGLSYIDSLSLTNRLPRRQPKLIVILALKNKAGQYLLAKRLVQPTIDTWMLPSGKRHFGETPQEHAERELSEQLSTTSVALTDRGTVDIRIWHDDVLVSHLVARLYVGQYEGSVPRDTTKFHYAWLDVGDVADFTPGTSEIIAALEKNDDVLDLSLDVSAV